MKKKLEKNQNKKILDKAYGYLARRDHSEGELKSKLLKKFPQRLLVEKVITRLKKLGYVDDAKFTQGWIEYRLSAKPRGRIIIKRELLMKGVKSELIEKTLNLVYNRDSEKKELARLLSLRANKYPPTRKGKNKLIAYLLRRGFLWEDIRELMESEGRLKIYK